MTLLMDVIEVPLEPPEGREAFSCSSCHGSIYTGEQCLIDGSGNAYHLNKKCLTEALTHNMVFLDENTLCELLTNHCDSTLEEAAW